MTLISFELRKVLMRKKAILFLLALNVVPILGSLLALLVFLKFRGMGGGLEFSALVQAVKGLFTGHIKLFAWIAPFFLALVIGDSFSGEAGRGYLKTELLTPVSRWQVLAAKATAILAFLVAAIVLGGLFLQINLWVAHHLAGNIPQMFGMKQASAQLVDTMTALRLLTIMFVNNLILIGFFILVALFTDSAILMAFSSLIIYMALHVYVLMAPLLSKLDARFGKVASWCFTKHLSEMVDVRTVQGILTKNVFLSSEKILQPMGAALLWGVFFYALCFIVFQRKQIFR